MNTTLPTRETRKPERAGLCHYEIIADGLIHTAAVFGFEPDELFVERVATLAWSNGVQLIRHDVRQAAKVAQLLGESLEVGRNETLQLCQELAARVDQPERAFPAIRGHYEESLKTRELSVGNPADADRIRRLIAEAILGGLLSRGLAPALYTALDEAADACRNEESFLTARVLFWSQNDGLPIDHPFLELAARFYRSHPHEKDLVCSAVAEHLHQLLALEDPWAAEHWLALAWKEGVMLAKLAPDAVALVVAELNEAERDANRKVYDDCVVPTATAGERVDLPAAYARYLAEWNPYGLADERRRRLNPRLVAVRAFDFAIWMAFIAERPESLGEKRSGQ